MNQLTLYYHLKLWFIEFSHNLSLQYVLSLVNFTRWFGLILCSNTKISPQSFFPVNSLTLLYLSLADSTHIWSFPNILTSFWSSFLDFSTIVHTPGTFQVISPSFCPSFLDFSTIAQKLKFSKCSWFRSAIHWWSFQLSFSFHHWEHIIISLITN